MTAQALPIKLIRKQDIIIMWMKNTSAPYTPNPLYIDGRLLYGASFSFQKEINSSL